MVTMIPVASSDGIKNPITIIFKGKVKGKEDKELVKRSDEIILFFIKDGCRLPQQLTS